MRANKGEGRKTDMNFKLSYLVAARLGELENLSPTPISPMHDLAPILAAQQKSLGEDGAAKLDELLSEEKLLVEENGKNHPAPQLRGFLKALFAPEKCLHTRLNEPGGCSDSYYLPFDGAWVRLDAIRGEFSLSFPLPEEGVFLCLRGDVEAALQGENVRLLAQRREGSVTRSAVVFSDEKGYPFFGTIADSEACTAKEYLHSFAKTPENRLWIAEMLSGRRAFELPESETEEEPPKRSYKGAVKGFLIGVAVNLCAALILALLKALL